LTALSRCGAFFATTAPETLTWVPPPWNVDPLLAALGPLKVDSTPLVEIARNRKAASLLVDKVPRAPSELRPLPARGERRFPEFHPSPPRMTETNRAVDPLLAALGPLKVDSTPLVEIARNRKAASLLVAHPRSEPTVRGSPSPFGAQASPRPRGEEISRVSSETREISSPRGRGEA
jgi:hypothetical protein